MSPAFCPQCGTAQASRANFCPDCGADLSTGAPPVLRREGEPVATVVAYAGFWRRLAAWVIDTVLVFVPSFIAAASIALRNVEDSDATGAQSGAFIGLWLAFGLAIGWVYSVSMESSSKQATFGKMVLGIVVTGDQGERIPVMRATRRYFAKILSGLVLGIGFVMAAWSDRKQGLHDMLAGTLVVQGRR